MRPVLVLNSGSSSVKFQVIDVTDERVLLAGQLERVSDHTAALEQVMAELEAKQISPVAIGHRVVHGGAEFAEPTLITPEVVAAIESLSQLAPLHNPANLAGIRAAQAKFANLPQVAVFDTAFHQTMPAASYSYAIDRELAEKHQIRKYGFHGTSHAFVSAAAAEWLGVNLDEFNAVTMHLGNGASACAIRGGRAVDTSMGFTPLAGLVMGTRSGDIDPALVFYLFEHTDYSLDEIAELLNSRSGLTGLTGRSDMRDVTALADTGDAQARLALEVYAHRARLYLGGYFAVAGPIHALVFTGGIGENAAEVRAMIAKNLEHLGVKLDDQRNRERAAGIRLISTDDSQVAILVVPTNEELEIARQTARVLHEG